MRSLSPIKPSHPALRCTNVIAWLLVVGLPLSSVFAGPPLPPSKRAAGARAASTQPVQREKTARPTALNATVVLKVANPTRARKAILSVVRSMNGHPSLITDQRLHVRVPPKQLGAFLTAITKQGFVLDKKLSRQDLTESIARARGRLRSKSKILGQLRGFLDDSGVTATLQIERTMSRLVTEIEALKGALRVALDRSTMADVRIAFQFRNPTQLRYVRSPFAWIDSVDVQRFLRGF